MADFETFWADLDEDSGPVLTEAVVRNWERTKGVVLPAFLRRAYLPRNGGCVRHTDIQLLPLSDFVPMDEDFWDHEEIPDDEAPDHDLVLRLGYDTSLGSQFLLNYNERGAEGEPSLYAYHNDGTGAQRIADSVGEFFEERLRFSTEPHLDWNEWKEGWNIVAQEGLEIPFQDGSRGRLEQVLARSGLRLVLFSRYELPDGLRLGRVELPLPLDSALAEIWPGRQWKEPTFRLHLQPEQTEGVVTRQSTRTEDGRWDNSVSHGVPMFAQFESPDRERLARTRDLLLGPKPTARPRPPVEPDLAAVARVQSLAKDDRAVAALLTALKAKAEWQQFLADTPGKVDPAGNALAWHMIKKLDDAIARAQADGAPESPDPETVRRISEALWPGQSGSEPV